MTEKKKKKASRCGEQVSEPAPRARRSVLSLACAVLLLSCAPARRGEGRATLAASRCAGSPMGQYLADQLADDPAAVDRLRTAMAEGQALREDVACGLYSLATTPAGSCPNGGCRGDVHRLATQLVVDAHRRGLLQLPVR